MALIVFGGAQALAFPNVGVTLQAAIHKQNQELNKENTPEGFKFGILGSIEFKKANPRFQADWRGVLARIKDETGLYERCSVSAADCPPNIRQWRELLQSLKGQPVKVQLARLNKSINRMAAYANDDKIFGKRDHWATPVEFLNGKADCEDYAVMKFWSLLALGFSNDQLRLAVVRDAKRKILHAVVTVETGGRRYVLDSLFDHPVEQKYVLKYAPIYSANLDSEWVHIVTRKIRVSYLDHLEDGAEPRVIPAQAKQRIQPSIRLAGEPITLAAAINPAFVDWT
ncbi:MAG: transglutaminase-like cysteine peptidase [Methyloligellaceae bacterium]